MMDNRKLLTIIIPSFKTAPFVDDCLPMFNEPGIKENVIIFMVDDGSPDEATPKKLMAYALSSPDTFSYFRKKNGGHGSTINFAIPFVRTPFFKVLDGDDWFDKTSLVNFLLFLARCKDDIVLSPYNKVLGKHIETVPLSDDVPSGNITGIPIKKITSFSIGLPSVTFSTSLWKRGKLSIREGSYYEDREYALFPIFYAKTFAYCNQSVYQYRVGEAEQSTSLISSTKHFHDFYLISTDLLDCYYSNRESNKCLSEYVGQDAVRLEHELLKSCLFPIKNGPKHQWKAKRKDLLALDKKIKQDPFLKHASKNGSLSFFRLINFRFLPFFSYVRKFLRKIREN